MFALGTEQDGRGAARGSRAGSFVAFQHSLVLPRWLRRPVRLFKRVNSGEVAPPRFAVTVMTAVFLAATGAYGAYVGGHVPDYAQAVTARTGFAVDQVRIVGHKHTSEIDILGSLDLSGWTSLVGFSAENARERVASLPWVEEASVRKIYPDGIEVHVKEREPFAIWQIGAELSVIEKDGRIIVPFTGGALSSLPQVIGVGAAEGAQAFLKEVSTHPGLAQRVQGYVRVADRRWDLVLNNGMTIKLPEIGEGKAMDELMAFDREGALLSRDVVGVDMRIPDRLVLQLSPEGLERRTAQLDAQAKARKKAGSKT